MRDERVLAGGRAHGCRGDAGGGLNDMDGGASDGDKAGAVDLVERVHGVKEIKRRGQVVDEWDTGEVEISPVSSRLRAEHRGRDDHRAAQVLRLYCGADGILKLRNEGREPPA